MSGDVTEVVHLEKTGPIKVLESRRTALITWLAEGRQEIAKAEEAIRKHKQDAIDMVAEIEEIEKALNVLNGVAVREKSDAA